MIGDGNKIKVTNLNTGDEMATFNTNVNKVSVFVSSIYFILS